MSENVQNKHFSQFYTLREYPIFMATLTKSGCTFLKNLFYFIDHGALHPLGDQIHIDESGLLRGSIEDVPMIEKSPFVYIVMRDPVDRFLSLYYEKIYGREVGSMDWFRISVGREIDMNFEEGISLEDHKINVLKLIKWLGKNLRNQTDIKIDYHWRRQENKWRKISGFSPKILTLDDLDRQLPHLLSPIIPDIKDKMTAVKSRNHSLKPFTYQETKTAELEALIRKIYRTDFELIGNARAYWNEVLGS